MRTVAGVGRVNVADAAWGTRANVDHGRDAFGRNVGNEKDTLEPLSQNGPQQPNEVDKPTEEANKKRRRRRGQAAHAMCFGPWRDRVPQPQTC